MNQESVNHELHNTNTIFKYYYWPASSSSSASYDPVNLTSSLSLSPSYRRTLASKIDNLVEISHILDGAQVKESLLPLISLYNIYRLSESFIRSIRTLISSRRMATKKYVQTSCLDQCALKSTTVEQYVTLEIPPVLIDTLELYRCF